MYDLMRKDTADDWATVRTRLGRTPEAMEQYVTSLRAGIARGDTPARLQVERCLQQAERYGSPQGFFAEPGPRRPSRRRAAARCARDRA
ncbi:hypothetical protein GCM10025868_35830 [Angustibacter aerolatus]|uniref:Uncharacterized protein n=1 Tax=Angustibacter aerolatus TaxID=1162965 RepID=A0ABQ6JJF0_9ACTN|nr:hypothetical protein GCM10025868_35830 [Angustibacter aerolatus]